MVDDNERKKIKILTMGCLILGIIIGFVVGYSVGVGGILI